MKKKRSFHSYDRTLTRAEAQELLDHLPSFQRNMSDSVVKRYTRDLEADNYVDGVPMVAVDGKGKLLNGQHVLASFLHSKKKELEITFQVNTDPRAYEAFDQLRKRSAKDALKAIGVDHPTEVAGVATVLWQYFRGSFNGKKWIAARNGEDFPTNAENKEILKKCPGIEAHLHKLPKEFKGCGFSMSAFRACSYVLHQIDQKAAQKFFQSLIEGINFPSTQDPVCSLRNYLLSLKNSRIRNGETMAVIFKTWELHRAGQLAPRGVQMKRTEEFPDVMHQAINSVVVN